VALIAQKMISDIAVDAFQQTNIRTTTHNAKGKQSKDRKYQLTMDDLTHVLAERGITVHKPPYYV